MRGACWWLSAQSWPGASGPLLSWGSCFFPVVFTFPGDVPKTDHFRVVTVGVTFQAGQKHGHRPKNRYFHASPMPFYREAFGSSSSVVSSHCMFDSVPNLHTVTVCGFEDAVGDGDVPPDHLVPFVQVHPETADAPLFLALLWVCPLTTETHDAVLCAHPLLIHTNADVGDGQRSFLCDARGHKLDDERSLHSSLAQILP